MSPATIPTPPPAPFQVDSVHFDFPGGRAIHLRDPASNQLVGAGPEWVRGTQNELAAYVRGTRPNLRVVFRGKPAANGKYTIGADGTPFQVEERDVSLSFDPITDLSGPEAFEARGNLPDVIGVHPAKLDWYVRENPPPVHCPPAGTSTHRLATSWRALAIAPAREGTLPTWVYKPLMEWTCQWAAGQTNERAICDAIFNGLPSSGLRYGVPAHTIRDLLLNQGGMCQAWYETFQQMAQCQGVFVYRRRFLVDWRQVGGEAHWCAIVVKSGGLNQTTPTHGPSTFHDHNGVFPIPAGTTVPITPVTEQRYRFFGLPGYWYDGHCINFLAYEGKVYLYDACFNLGSVVINSPIPTINLAVPQGGAALAPFRAAYLDGAVDHMLGSIRNGAVLFNTVRVFPHGPTFQNGMTVRTANIPQRVAGADGLTFRWGG